MNLGEVLTVHREKSHQNQSINETMLTRLWILEETLLSNTIQFVDGRPHATHQRLYTSGTAQLTSVRFVMKLRELAKAWAGAYHPWQSTPTSAIEVDTLAFIRGYFTNGTVRRQGLNIRVSHPFPELHTFYRHIFSTRRTSKSRDFILATMPQYSFYHVPPNAKSMNFGDLFKDCVYQLWRAGFPVQPIVPRHHIMTLELSSPEYQIRLEEDEDVAFPDGRDEILQKFPLPDIADVPEPACLGDLVKLFCGLRIVFNFYPPLDASSMDINKYIASPPEYLRPFNPFSVILPRNRTRIKVDQQEEWRVLSSSFNIRMSVERIRRVGIVEVTVSSKHELMSLLSEVTSSSRLVWEASILGELHEIATAADELDEGVSHHPRADERLAAKFLHSWCISDYGEPSEDATVSWEEYPDLDGSREGHLFGNNVVRLASLITCGLGLSAYEWSKQHIVPVLVVLSADKRVMALVPSSVLQSEMRYEFWLLGAITPGEDRWTLVVRSSGAEDVLIPCIFPWDVDVGSI
jgi:hypothetical protein